MSLKSYLKAAKAAIDQKNGEDALDSADEVLSIDPQNYFGHLFKARGYQLLGKQEEAEKSFQNAVDIEPDNLLGWKGYFQAIKNTSDYEKFFTVLAGSVERLAEQNELLEHVPREIYAFLHKNNFKSDSKLNEVYLRAILPDTRLGSLLEGRLGSTLENIRKLLVFVKSREDLEVLSAILKEKLKLPKNLTQEMQLSLNSIEWAIRQKFDVVNLYEQFLSYCDDDTQRRQYEIEFLRYKYSLLRIVDDQTKLMTDVKEMAADLVLLKCDDSFPWSLHFDLQDTQSLALLDPQFVSTFLKKFKKEPLGLVLYLFVMSELCPLDKEYFKDLESEEKNNLAANEDKIAEDFILDSEIDSSLLHLSQTEITKIMAKGFEGCSTSILAHRIVAHVNNFYSEYAFSLKVCADGIRRLSSQQTMYGLDLRNAREDLTCQLALVYTYYEAPKNFGRALQIFDKILSTNPLNEQALIGKGLILVEKGEYKKAQLLLADVIKRSPGNPQALNDLGWCLILQGDFKQGREYLKQAMENVAGMSLRAFELRANINWRRASSYLDENADDDQNVKAAYNLLISSLKNSKFHAPSYTLLGRILHDYYEDKVRAQKCFYKAFELDVAEITAAKYLVEELCAKRDWDVTEILCERVVESEKSRKVLFSQLNTDPDRSWPYRVLGCSALNRQDDAKAIEWFQTALRMQAMDIECWTGLGEAYFNCGRIEAAIKVFQHTTELEGCNWVNYYMLGQAVCMIGDYASGLELLDKSLGMNPISQCIISAIYEQNILYSTQLLQGGFIGRTLEYNRKAIDAIAIASEESKSSFMMWKSLGDCIGVICKIQREIESAPIETIFGILEHAENIDDQLASLSTAKLLFEDNKHVDCVALLGILAGKAALGKLTKRDNKLVRSALLFNLGLAYINAFHVGLEKNNKFRDQAIITLKEAIKLESQNAQYWISLGIAYVSFNPSLLQHSFIKASVLDSKDVSPWTNLAALYLRYGDAELAKEAFERATSVAPELATPWLGKALASDLLGDPETSSRLTTHAQVLSNGTSPLAQLCYAITVVDNRIKKVSSAQNVAAAQEVSVANAAIRRFLQFEPQNITGLKLAFILSERCHTFEISVEIGKTLILALEIEYEKSESALALLDLGIAKSQLARVLLGNGQFDDAVDHAQFTIDLLSEEEANLEVEKAMLSSRIVIGLAFFFNQQYQEALEEFQIILDEHSLSHKAITLIAQVLYAMDSPESKQAAVDHLFSFIEENGSSLLVVMTLGAISLADDYSSYFEAIKEELEGLSLVDLIEDSRNAVPRLLKELNSAMGKSNARVWQKFALLFPGDFRVWKQLDSLMALSSSLLNEAKATAPEVSSAYVEKKSRREMQRALLVFADNAAARAALSSN